MSVSGRHRSYGSVRSFASIRTEAVLWQTTPWASLRDAETLDVGLLSEPRARALRKAVRQDLSRARATLNLLVNKAVQAELDKIPGTDGIQAISTVCAVPVPDLWQLLAGDYVIAESSWSEMERLLTICDPAYAGERVFAGRRLFNDLVTLHTCDRRLGDRLAELDRTRRAGIYPVLQPAQPTRGSDATQPGRGLRKCQMCGATSTYPWAKAEQARRGSWISCPVCGAALDRPTADITVRVKKIPRARVVSGSLRLNNSPDLPGLTLKPDPITADTPEKFVDLMRAYKAWAGEPSWRTMAARCDGKISYSTFRAMLNRKTLPAELWQVHTLVTVLGGTDDDRDRWTYAWRKLKIAAGQRANPAADQEDQTPHLHIAAS